MPSDVIAVPETLDAVLDPEWLRMALAPRSGGAAIADVTLTEVQKTMASKVRIGVRFEGSDEVQHYCIKSFLDFDRDPTTIREARFYDEIAPKIDMRVPGCANAIIDEEGQRGILIMDDLIAQGAHFCGALEHVTADQAASFLEQLACLHSQTALVDLPWLPCRIQNIAANFHYPVEQVQGYLDDGRGVTLTDQVRDAALLYRSMEVLAEDNRSRPQMLLHGDCHAGNIYLAKDGPGFTDWQLVQRGTWAYDVAYMTCAVLPVEVAEVEERRLLDHYLEVMAAKGASMPDREDAWEIYRRSQSYGFYHWAITARAKQEIANEFTKRLGAGVARHDTYKLLGVV